MNIDMEMNRHATDIFEYTPLLLVLTWRRLNLLAAGQCCQKDSQYENKRKLAKAATRKLQIFTDYLAPMLINRRLHCSHCRHTSNSVCTVIPLVLCALSFSFVQGVAKPKEYISIYSSPDWTGQTLCFIVSLYE